MKVAVIGSRALDIDIGKYIERFINPNDITVIISGGAKGIDMLAERYAESRDIPIQVFYPEYKKYGVRAPVVRNMHIVDDADIVVAFWDRQSRGTKFVIDYAKKSGKKLIELRVDT